MFQNSIDSLAPLPDGPVATPYPAPLHDPVARPKCGGGSLVIVGLFVAGAIPRTIGRCDGCGRRQWIDPATLAAVADLRPDLAPYLRDADGNAPMPPSRVAAPIDSAWRALLAEVAREVAATDQFDAPADAAAVVAGLPIVLGDGMRLLWIFGRLMPESTGGASDRREWGHLGRPGSAWARLEVVLRDAEAAGASKARVTVGGRRR